MEGLPITTPGARDNKASTKVLCLIKRDAKKSTYQLLQCTATEPEEGKLLLAARKIRSATGTDYIIYSDFDDMFNGSGDNIVGKLRSNFLGTKFIIYETQPPSNGAVSSTNHETSGWHKGDKVSPRAPAAGSYNVTAHIAYKSASLFEEVCPMRI